MVQAAWRHSWRLHGVFLVVVLALACYHPRVQRGIIGQCISLFERECSVSISARDAVFHPLMGSIAFQDLSIKKEGAERPFLTAQRTGFAFAPVQSVLCGKVIFESSISGMRVPMGRGIDALLDVVDFFKALLATSSEYVSLRGLHLDDVALGDMKASVDLAAAEEDPTHEPACHVMRGELKFPVTRPEKIPVRIGKLVMGIPSPSGVRTVVGELYGRGEISTCLIREGQQVKMRVEYSPHSVTYRGVAPADDLVACMDGLFPGKSIGEHYGMYRSFTRAHDLLIKCRGSYVPRTKAGKIQFLSVHHRSAEPTSMSGVIVHRDDQILCDASVALRENFTVRARVIGNLLSKTVRAQIANETPITTFFGKAHIPPRSLCVLLKSGMFNTVIGRFACKIHDPDYLGDIMLATRGIFSVRDGSVCFTGNLNKKTAYGLASFHEGPRLKRFVVLDEHGNPDVDIKSSGVCDAQVRGTLSRQSMRLCIPRSARSVMHGDAGTVSFSFDQSAMPLRLRGEVALNDCSYCFLGSSNPLVSAKMTIDTDFMLRAATISDVECVCASGSISSKEMLLNWSNEGISYMHVPIVISDMFVNSGKDVCAIIDGECAVDWIDGGKHRLDGALTIKKSRIRSLDFADTAPAHRTIGLPYVHAAQKVDEFGIDANVSVKTDEPLMITTPLLRTRAHVDAKLGGYLRGDGSLHPKFSGTVRLDGGVLDVLGRPLRIMRGSLDVLPNQSDNPIIDFLAYTNVKQYRIAIHGSGSLLQPNFVFESSPPLSQEQIIGLVLSGSEYADVNQQLPGLFLQNIHKLIRPNADGIEKGALLQQLATSLRYVQLLPYQDSISSEKTVRARLNIDLGPHLRALVHKDIFGKEAVALQVEYDVSDELNVRLLRQSSGQVGAEAEIRFKFG